MSSISNTFSRCGIEGLTDLGQKKLSTDLMNAGGGGALMITGLVGGVIMILLISGVIPSNLSPVPLDGLSNIVVSMICEASIITAIAGSAVLGMGISGLTEELNEEERSTLLISAEEVDQDVFGDEELELKDSEGEDEDDALTSTECSSD